MTILIDYACRYVKGYRSGRELITLRLHNVNILDIFFPKHCVACGRIGNYFCDACRAKIRPISDNERICPMCGRLAFGGVTHPKCRTRYGIDGLTSFFHYDGPVRKAVKALKYRLVSDVAKEFVGLIRIPKQVGNDSILVPIPLHASRLRERGFNQAEVLGRAVAARLHIPVRTDILRRIRATPPQAEIKKREDRIKNMKNSFSIHNSLFLIHNSRIVLFDDVCTTGATLRNAASALKRAGAHHIWAITIAQ